MLRNAREALGYSREKLSELSGVSVRHIATIEGGGNASLEKIRSMASALYVDSLELDGLTLTASGNDHAVPFPLLDKTLRDLERDSAAFHAKVSRTRRAVASLDAHPRRIRPQERDPAPDLRQVRLPIPPLFTWPSGGGEIREDAERWISVALAGEIAFGEPIYSAENDEHVALPSSIIEPGERVYRVRGMTLGEWNIEDRDLLVVEPRDDGSASNGEFVIALIGERVVVGRWWSKHGIKQVLSVRSLRTRETGAALRVIGAINQIIRE